MKKINSYIIEKLKLNKNSETSNDPEFDKFYKFIIDLLDEEKLSYTAEIDDEDPDNKILIVTVTNKFLLDKTQAIRYVGNINTTLYANKINYAAHYPTIHKKSNRKVSMTMEFYKVKR